MKNFLLDETGLELSEYAVAAALVALAVAAAFTGTGRCDRSSTKSTCVARHWVTESLAN
jgi:hypothetical protein